jgi:hypothetical protein
MIRRLHASLALIALVLAACTPPPDEVSTASDPSSSGTTATTTPGTTMPGEGTMGTQGETGMDTTAGTMDTTTSPTTGSSGPSGCMVPEDCSGNEVCENGTCEEACGGAWGEGSYGYCLTDYGGSDAEGICGLEHRCARAGDPIEQAACSLQGCDDACDCPPPAATGNATVTCGPFLLVTNGCYLSCANGETCPDDMTCVDGIVCMTEVPEVPVYGNCGNLASGCAAPGFCVLLPSGESICSMSCTDMSECPGASPRGGDASPACTDITADMAGFECYLSCIGDVACPNGMSCVNGTLCAWPD